MMRTLPTVLLCLLVWGCVSAPVKRGVDLKLSPKQLFESACGAHSPGAGISAVTGKAWMKAASHEASGQFPASVEVKNGTSLLMEVTNLLGATQATIRVDGRKYLIEAPDDGSGKKYRKEGADSWGGIPLAWAVPLFMGRVPCPPVETLRDAAFKLTEKGELLVHTGASLEKEEQEFRYGFREWEGEPWPESLQWDRKGPLPLTVNFKFDDPEKQTRSPRKWEAKSALGEVKVRWKGRELK